VRSNSLHRVLGLFQLTFVLDRQRAPAPKLWQVDRLYLVFKISSPNLIPFGFWRITRKREDVSIDVGECPQVSSLSAFELVPLIILQLSLMYWLVLQLSLKSLLIFQLSLMP
jgi:hypothetical protein